jgi:uncharacterized protein YfaS (alpha-2-macroglobulin family)
MRNLFNVVLFTCFILFLAKSGHAQIPVKSYEKEWKKVDELVTKKNLPKSALKEVKKIYQQAKKDEQEAQIIKALVYMIGLQQENREENQTLSIGEIEKEISLSKEPVISILESLLAEIYWNYFQQNRWQLYNRTQTKDIKKEDIATWTAEDFHRKISELYLHSISNEKLLRQTTLEPFDAIITKGNTRHLRPTLYDLLAHRALDYFRNTERDIKKPAYAFEINQAEAFGPAAQFITYKFVTKDSLSLFHKALLIYQKLLAFHLGDSKPDALLDVDIERISFVKEQGVMDNKDSLYRKALEQIVAKYPDNSVTAQAWYLIASLYEEQAATYQPYGDTTHRFDRIKSKEICENVLKHFDSTNSEGWVNCYNLLIEINKKDLSFNIERVNIPNEAFRALVNYRNISRLYLRIIKPDEKLKNEIERQDENYWSKLAAASPIKSWQQTLPLTNDMQQHAVEIKVDALPAGEYILLASAGEFKENKAIMGARIFYTSNISFINNQQDYFVLHRESGQPLSNAKVNVWEQKYDYKISKYVKEKTAQYKTDKNGFFQTAKRKNDQGSSNYLLDITYNDDNLFMNEYIYDYYYYYNPDNINSAEDKNTKIFFFTDRSIYRPGQVVYFKGIVITPEQGSKNNKIRADYSTTVYLRDANAQNVDSIKVTTNEFGSFSGKFQLPQGSLNGQFNIFTKKSQGTMIRVEEYKRPKFFVDYEKIKGTYKVNDKIRITGSAKAYAGNNIGGAVVTWRVVRQPRFIYPWLYWRGWLPRADPMEIAHGETKTDKEGKFFIEFTAIPDLKMDKKLDPVFDYRIYADVADINGETRSGETIVPVSYKSLLLKVNVPTVLPVDSLKTISILTENLGGEFQTAQVKVSITKLIPEQRLIRNRYWQRPDQFIMSKEEFLKYFPHDEYDNESDYKNWNKGEKVFEGSDSTKANSQWPIVPQGPAHGAPGAGNRQFLPGFYIIEIETRDKNGELVKDVKYIELYDERSNQLSRPVYLWTQGADKPIEPGEKTSVKIGSSAGNVFLVQQVDRQLAMGNQQLANADYNYLNLNDEKKLFVFSATEQDRGGYGVNYIFVKDNRFYQFEDVIQVPWTNKDLKIEYASFRDKTLPGSEEKWKLKITGYKNEKVAAEMLASMYDASLDQFLPHDWSVPGIWPYYSGRSSWSGSYNFAEIQSQQISISERQSKTFQKEYDRLITSNYGGYWGRNKYLLAPSFRNVEAMKRDGVPGVADTVAVRDPDDANKTMQFVVVKEKEELKQEYTDNGNIQIRRNFNETAFFLPDLRTDSSGAIEFSFTIPEALTKWKFQALTHTKELAFALSQKEIITQKQLMVQPNMPRFLREGDRLEFSAKIVNLTEKEMTGQAELQLFDAATNQPVDGWFQNMFPNQYFTVAAGQSGEIQFPVQVPYQFNKALTWRIVAKSTAGAGAEGIYSDGEEDALPVLTNRMLVTETLPLPVRGDGTKIFKFEKLLNSGKSETLQNHALTIEYTSNPAWYAVQALPYLIDYPYECAEQTWNRYYANSLASKIANSSPRIRQVFEQWKIKDTSALLSNLQKNQELKSVLLEETPWVLEAKTETEQKKNIALLFDLVRMSNELNNSLEKLKQMQSENGGFVWFKGGPDDRYITQYIITGIGHLKKINGYIKSNEAKLKSILNTAIPYLDRKIKEDYDNLVKNKADLKKENIGYSQIQYLYMRSFFSELKIPQASQTAYNYYHEQSKLYWIKQDKYMQGMIALSLYRTGDNQTPVSILKSLKETSITNQELGMYWKDMNIGWFWYQAPIETQALLIEAFTEIGNNSVAVDDMRTWLLKNKQTNNWRTTKATAEACYALLLQGTEWLATEPVVEIKLGNTTVSSAASTTEAGTGYFKQTIDGQSVKPEMGNISVTISSPTNSGQQGVSWGAVYWQYFENLDKITTSSTPLKLVKKLFVEKNTDRGPVLTPVNEGTILKTGDRIKVRIELRVDRDMEYVHMKDMRASAFEPVNVLSGYKWQGGLGYYESTKDASTNFFFDHLRKGTYVFEYPLFVTLAGNFSNGVTSIQCMYAPEFSSHSEGIRINVEK